MLTLNAGVMALGDEATPDGFGSSQTISQFLLTSLSWDLLERVLGSHSTTGPVNSIIARTVSTDCD